MIAWMKASWFVLLLGMVVIAVSLLLLWDFLVVNLTRGGAQAPVISSPALKKPALRY